MVRTLIRHQLTALKLPINSHHAKGLIRIHIGSLKAAIQLRKDHNSENEAQNMPQHRVAPSYDEVMQTSPHEEVEQSQHDAPNHGSDVREPSHEEHDPVQPEMVEFTPIIQATTPTLYVRSILQVREDRCCSHQPRDNT